MAVGIDQREENRLNALTYGMTKVHFEAMVLEQDLGMFIRAVWKVAEPSVELIESPYLDAICQHLQALTETRERLIRSKSVAGAIDTGTIRNLIINVPPRSLKSTICSVLWPVWMWTRDPGVRILSSSYSSNLAERDSVRSRRILQSKWYQRRWGHKVRLERDQNRKDRYNNTAGGFRLAIGKGGPATGEGGDILICDDPQSVLEAYSASARTLTLEWFGNVWSNRMNDPKRSVLLVVQQRIHEDDLSGHLLESGGWEHLKLPMQYEGEPNRTVLGWTDWRTDEAEWLLPDRFSEDERQDVIRRAGEIGYATQYQQRPVARGGAILKEDRWARYRHADLPERFKRVAIFVDTAAKAKERNDYSALALWGEDERGWWLMDLVWGKWEFPELEEQVIRAWNTWRLLPLGRRPMRMVVEDASSGTQLIQTLRKRTKIPMVEYSSKGDKEERVNLIAAWQHAGKLHLPVGDSEGIGTFDVESFIAEHSMFPNAAHDDRVDTTTMMMLYWEIAPPDKPYTTDVVYTATAKGRW